MEYKCNKLLCKVGYCRFSKERINDLVHKRLLTPDGGHFRLHQTENPENHEGMGY